jgi:hypothetical protein
VMYRVLHGAPFDRGGIAPKAPDGYVLLATFDSAHRQAPNYSWFAVYGRPESKIGRGIAPGASARGRLRHALSKRATKWSDRPKIRLAGHG